MDSTKRTSLRITQDRIYGTINDKPCLGMSYLVPDASGPSLDEIESLLLATSHAADKLAHETGGIYVVAVSLYRCFTINGEVRAKFLADAMPYMSDATDTIH